MTALDDAFYDYPAHLTTTKTMPVTTAPQEPLEDRRMDTAIEAQLAASEAQRLRQEAAAAKKAATLQPPTAPGQWTLEHTIAALSRKLPESMLKERKAGGTVVKYLPWYRACKILQKYAPGFNYEVVKVKTITGTVGLNPVDKTMVPGMHDRIVVVCSITLACSDAVVTRQATGTEFLSMSGYGDPSSNAESMALRRAAAKFGLAAYLYEK